MKTDAKSTLPKLIEMRFLTIRLASNCYCSFKRIASMELPIKQ